MAVEKRKRIRKKHNTRFTVNLDLKAWDIAKAGAALTFKIKDASETLGTIQIGQGAFRWKGRYGQKYRRLNWQRLFQKLS